MGIFKKIAAKHSRAEGESGSRPEFGHVTSNKKLAGKNCRFIGFSVEPIASARDQLSLRRHFEIQFYSVPVTFCFSLEKEKKTFRSGFKVNAVVGHLSVCNMSTAERKLLVYLQETDLAFLCRAFSAAAALAAAPPATPANGAFASFFFIFLSHFGVAFSDSLMFKEQGVSPKVCWKFLTAT